MSFNRSTIAFKQERLAKEDIELLIEAVKALHESNDTVSFLLAKLKRMKDQFR